VRLLRFRNHGYALGQRHITVVPRSIQDNMSTDDRQVPKRATRKCPWGLFCRMKVRLSIDLPVLDHWLINLDYGSWADEMEDMPLPCMFTRVETVC
jgi:hypothetical protein